jgi:hypothetical protein
VDLYRDAAHAQHVDWTYTDSQVCPLILLAPSKLAPGDTVTFSKVFHTPPTGNYYGVATVWAEGALRRIDLGPVVIPHPLRRAITEREMNGVPALEIPQFKRWNRDNERPELIERPLELRQILLVGEQREVSVPAKLCCAV